MNDRELKELDSLIRELQVYTRSLERAEELNDRLERISWAIERAKVRDILINYTNPRRVFFINILVGVGRGLGLTLGTVIVLSLLGLILRQFVDVPLVGEWISNLLEHVNLGNRSISGS